MSEAAYFPESWPLSFDFLITFDVKEPDPNPVPELEP
jgi:hypothetical protein